MFVIQNIVFVLSAVFLRIKKLFGRMVFAYERRLFVRANRRIDLSQKVVNIPDEFGGGCLYMDEGGKFFIVRHTSRLFNLKIEKLTKQQAIDYAWVSWFRHIDWHHQNSDKEQFYIEVARRNFNHFFGDCLFREIHAKAMKLV